jgi:hypothetical protein
MRLPTEEVKTVNPKNPTDALLRKITKAVRAVDEAAQTVNVAQAELISREKAVGFLLLEAKKLHPTVMDFAAFLEQRVGLSLSRAYDFMRVAGDRITGDELREEARLRKQKERAGKQLVAGWNESLKAKPTPPQKDSVTCANVTESPPCPEVIASTATPTKASVGAFEEFASAARVYLPLMTVAEQHEARRLVAELTSAPKAEAA